jgi:hypothetical protein
VSISSKLPNEIIPNEGEHFAFSEVTAFDIKNFIEYTRESRLIGERLKSPKFKG